MLTWNEGSLWRQANERGPRWFSSEIKTVFAQYTFDYSPAKG